MTATGRMRSSACDTRSPALSPVRALLARIPLGPRPSLHRLRCFRLRRRSLCTGLFRFVRRLPSYYGEVRLLGSVHHRLRLLTFPTRTAAGLLPRGRPRDLSVPVRGTSAYARVSDPAGPARRLRWRATPCCLPPLGQRRHPGLIWITGLNGWPMHAPTNASPRPHGTSTHGSGASAGRYSFTAMDFHHLFRAGLYRRFPKAPR